MKAVILLLLLTITAFTQSSIQQSYEPNPTATGGTSSGYTHGSTNEWTHTKKNGKKNNELSEAQIQ